MDVDPNAFNKKLRTEAKERQATLRHLTDDQVRALHFETILGDRVDVTLALATHWEVQARWLSAGWMWKRLLNPARYREWLIHSHFAEAAASEKAIQVVRKTSDPATGERLIRGLEAKIQLHKAKAEEIAISKKRYWGG